MMMRSPQCITGRFLERNRIAPLIGAHRLWGLAEVADSSARIPLMPKYISEMGGGPAPINGFFTLIPRNYLELCVIKLQQGKHIDMNYVAYDWFRAERML
jgi:hypothetical protein